MNCAAAFPAEVQLPQGWPRTMLRILWQDQHNSVGERESSSHAGRRPRQLQPYRKCIACLTRGTKQHVPACYSIHISSDAKRKAMRQTHQMQPKPTEVGPCSCLAADLARQSPHAGHTGVMACRSLAMTEHSSTVRTLALGSSLRLEEAALLSDSPAAACLASCRPLRCIHPGLHALTLALCSPTCCSEAFEAPC